MLVEANVLPPDELSVDWSFSLENSQLERGNAVMVWNDWVFATTALGTLYRLPRQFPDNMLKEESNFNNSNNTQVSQFTPPTDNENNKITCQSGAVIVGEVLVYVVLEESDNDKSSRMLGVNALTMELQWSLALDNVVVAGTPVLGNSTSGNYLYASHYSPEKGGQMTVVKVDSDVAVAATLDLGSDPVTPPAIAGSNNNNSNDVVVYVAATTNNGDGRLWSVSWSSQHATLQGKSEEAYTVQTVSDLASSAVAPPVVTAQGGVYLGQDESLVLGWDNGASSGVPDWGYSLQVGSDNPNAREFANVGHFSFSCSIGSDFLKFHVCF